MRITVEIPDEFAARLAPAGQDPARKALEDMAVEAYRGHRLSEHELAILLGLDRYTLDGFLKERGVWFEYTLGDLEREEAEGRSAWEERQAEPASKRPAE